MVASDRLIVRRDPIWGSRLNVTITVTERTWATITRALVAVAHGNGTNVDIAIQAGRIVDEWALGEEQRTGVTTTLYQRQPRLK